MDKIDQEPSLGNISLAARRSDMYKALLDVRTAGACKKDAREAEVDDLVAIARTALQKYTKELRRDTPEDPRVFIESHARESILNYFAPLAINDGVDAPTTLKELEDDPRLQSPIQEAIEREKAMVTEKVARAVNVSPDEVWRLGPDCTDINLAAAYLFVRRNDEAKLSNYFINTLVAGTYDRDELFDERLGAIAHSGV